MKPYLHKTLAAAQFPSYVQLGTKTANLLVVRFSLQLGIATKTAAQLPPLLRTNTDVVFPPHPGGFFFFLPPSLHPCVRACGR